MGGRTLHLWPHKYRHHVRAGALALIAFELLGAGLLLWRVRHPARPIRLGATFSWMYARELGLSYKETYTAVLDDLGVQKLRLPLYWSDIESTRDRYDWSVPDWLLDEAARHGVKVTLVVGEKVPRYPECFIPPWADALSQQTRATELLSYVGAAATRYAHHPAVVSWQVENERSFAFGVCPLHDPDLFSKEIALVRETTGKPIQLTVSGELESWATAAPADVIGISLYRETYNQRFGSFLYPWSPRFYAARAAAARRPDQGLVISELQGEPWFDAPIGTRSLAAWAALFGAADLRSQIRFASRTGIIEADLWGVEWWYLLKTRGYPELWEAGREEMQKSATLSPL
ncbi:hypothetical protein HYV73_04360 [Candidatus Uhrbacteria bacterium]|nr:hypothetical protein [Candidatus Uhrbacteria bacterium]